MDSNTSDTFKPKKNSKKGQPKVKPEKVVKDTSPGQPSLFLKSQSKEIALSVLSFFEKEKIANGPIIPFEKSRTRACAALNIGFSTLYRISKEKEAMDKSNARSYKFRTPGKKKFRKPPITYLDPFQEYNIKKLIYNFYLRKKYPSLNKLHAALTKAKISEASKTSLHRIIPTLGFEFYIIDGKKLLLERTDVVERRSRFLAKIVKVDFDKVIWVGKTLINAGNVLTKEYTTANSMPTIAKLIRKEGTLVIVHAGSSAGFVPNGMAILHSKTINEFDEMNCEIFSRFFLEWFRSQLLPNIGCNQVIVMDNILYHALQTDKIPTMANKMEDIKLWLTNKNIEYPENATKGTLLGLVSLYNRPAYFFDQFATQWGHTLVCLPPYHAHLNPIELVWAQVKKHVAENVVGNNIRFKMSEVEGLTKVAIAMLGEQEWNNAVGCVREVIKETLVKEPQLDDAVDELITGLASYRCNLGNQSSSSSDAEMEEDNVMTLNS